MSALLNHNQQHITNWKGKTLTQIMVEISKNKDWNPSVDTEIKTDNLFRALPNKVFRKEIVSKKMNVYSSSKKMSIDDINAPGGYITNTAYTNDDINTSEGLVTFIDYDNLVPNDTTYQPGVCTNSYVCNETNARNRIRTSGIVKPNYNYNNKQYLNSRRKTFDQNQYTYASNTVDTTVNVTDMSGVCHLKAVTYKPSNTQFATQGAVSAGDLIARIKYDNITNMGTKYRNAYGSSVARAYAYNVSNDVYNEKEKVGYRLTATPTFNPVNGTMKSCSIPPRIRR